MLVKSASAGLLLKETVIKSLSIKNKLFATGADLVNDGVLDMDYSIVEISRRGDTHIGVLDLSINYKLKDKKKLYLSLQMTISGILSASTNVYEEERDFRDAVEINGLAALISIARANVSTITSNVLGRGCITLPMINVFNLVEQKAQESKD